MIRLEPFLRRFELLLLRPGCQSFYVRSAVCLR